ncbi:MAG: hypothetical protein AABY22_08330, partial [Nanoarchaeota archaeon]
MRIFFSFLFIFLSASLSHAVYVVYKTTSGEIIEIGYADITRFKKESGVSIAAIQESSVTYFSCGEINCLPYMKYDSTANAVIPHIQSKIDSLKSNEQLKNDMKDLESKSKRLREIDLLISENASQKIKDYFNKEKDTLTS